MLETQTKIIDYEGVETVLYKERMYYDLFDVLKYLISETDLLKFNKLKREMNIDVCNLKVQINGIFTCRKYIDRENLIKLLWCINNPKIYNIRKWMLSVIEERFKEMINPDIAIDRFKTLSIKKGKNFKFLIKTEEEKLNINVMTAQQIFNEEIRNISVNSTNVD